MGILQDFHIYKQNDCEVDQVSNKPQIRSFATMNLIYRANALFGLEPINLRSIFQGGEAAEEDHRPLDGSICKPFEEKFGVEQLTFLPLLIQYRVMSQSIFVVLKVHDAICHHRERSEQNVEELNDPGTVKVLSLVAGVDGEDDRRDQEQKVFIDDEKCHVSILSVRFSSMKEQKVL